MLLYRQEFWYHLNFWYRGTERVMRASVKLFWYHLNFWYRGTVRHLSACGLRFGIISIFGIELHGYHKPPLESVLLQTQNFQIRSFLRFIY